MVYMMRDANGSPLDARFEVKSGQEETVIAFHSCGGNPYVNRDYNQALEYLLKQLFAHGLVIADVAVDSRTSRKRLPYEDRRLHLPDYPYPITKDHVADCEHLRKQMGRVMAKTARTPGGEHGSGCFQKRIAITLDDVKEDAVTRLIELIAEVPIVHWACVIRPDVYDIRAAVGSECQIHIAMDKRSRRQAPQNDDRILFWKDKGPEAHRGIVAFGTILAVDQDPGPFPPDTYWQKGAKEPDTCYYLVAIDQPPEQRYWLEEDSSGFLAQCNFVKAKGGTFFRIDPDDWARLLTLVDHTEPGSIPGISSSEEKSPITPVDLPPVDPCTEPPTGLYLPAPSGREGRATKTDWDERDKANRKQGLAAELWVLEQERRRLEKSGRPDLARMIVHVSVAEGDGLGYDIRSFNEDGSTRHIEVKGTQRGIDTPFFLTVNEVQFSRKHPETFFL